MKHLLIMSIVLMLNCYAQQDFWQNMNGVKPNVLHDKLIKGIDLNEYNDLIVATDSAGVYRSTDRGVNWIEINNGLTDLNCYTLAKNAGGNLFVGTYKRGTLEQVGKIFRSTDSGENWTKVFELVGNFTEVTAIAINGAGHIFAGIYGAGIYRSTDNGESWTQINNGLTYPWITSIKINTNNEIFAGAHRAILKSTNNGDTWTQVTPGNNQINPVIVINSSNHIYAGTLSGIIKSTDGGMSWTEINSGLNDLVATYIGITEENYIFVTTDVTYRTSNGGENWEPVIGTIGLTTLVEIGTDSIIGGTKEGLYVSSDNGLNWDRLGPTFSNTINNYVWDISFDQNGGVWAGTDGGIYFTNDNGENWLLRNAGLFETGVSSVTISQNGYIYAGISSGFGGIYRATIYEPTWVKLFLGVNTSITALAADSAERVYAGAYGGFYRSSDNGNTWENINQLGSGIRTINLRASENIFIGTIGYANNGIFKSTDTGITWDQLLKIDSVNYDGVVGTAISQSGTIFAGTFFKGIYRSTDQGINWTQVNNNLTEVLDIIIHWDNTIYAGSNEGVFLSRDNGNNWTALNEGLTTLKILSLAFSQDGYLFAGTYGGGIFRSINQIVGVDEVLKIQIPSEYNLEQNYPNPFNPATVIRYQVPVAGNVALKVYDVLGKEISILVSEEKLAGSYEIEFIASQLASGIYFYTLSAGDFRQTKKMILMK